MADRSVFYPLSGVILFEFDKLKKNVSHKNVLVPVTKKGFWRIPAGKVMEFMEGL